MTSWFFDLRNGGWFKDVFAEEDYNPIAVSMFDGDGAEDRRLLIGSEDGFVRTYDETAADDDGTPFESSVVLGPMISEGGRRTRLVVSELRPQLSRDSDTVLYEIAAGDTAEAALGTLAGTFAGDGSFAAGLRRTANPRAGGYVVFVKVGTAQASAPWAMEVMRVRAMNVASHRGRYRAAD